MTSTVPFSRPDLAQLSELAVANVNYDGTGTVVDATETPVAGTPGIAVESLSITLEEAIADSSFKVLQHDGTKFHMIFEADIEPITPAAGTINSQQVFDRSHPLVGRHFPIIIPGGHRLGTALHTADAATVKAQSKRL